MNTKNKTKLFIKVESTILDSFFNTRTYKTNILIAIGYKFIIGTAYCT